MCTLSGYIGLLINAKKDEDFLTRSCVLNHTSRTEVSIRSRDAKVVCVLYMTKGVDK